MTDLTRQLTDLRRPRLLVRAARHGLSSYRRTRDLQRIAGQAQSATPQTVVESLIHQEDQIEQARLAGDGTYSANKHIEVLIALMAESRTLPAPTRPAGRPGWRPTVVNTP
ncbi:DUF6477 family protein [Litoreibacter albidus]|uniref:Uncharacterized protein n=1 Tax=Litoreibacter albidus TaxID=670155 RepID=A0A1H2XER3_9RHOB|nr:DUF6477 family protein [Litoreibacter albidus]SDW91325.1 hypothetical protein SAMN04488001_1956 [Litoreibacter albidus]